MEKFIKIWRSTYIWLLIFLLVLLFATFDHVHISFFILAFYFFVHLIIEFYKKVAAREKVVTVCLILIFLYFSFVK